MLGCTGSDTFIIQQDGNGTGSLIDTNWQTDFNTFDNNMRATYLPITTVLPQTKIFVAKKFITDYNSITGYFNSQALSFTDLNSGFPLACPTGSYIYQLAPGVAYCSYPTFTDTNEFTAGRVNSNGVRLTDFNGGGKSLYNWADVNGSSLYISGNIKVDGNMSIKRPYGVYSSMKTQTVGSTSVAYYMDFNTTEDDYAIVKTGDTNFSVLQSGDYMINISIVGVSSTAGKILNVWVRKNGVDVPRSNTPYQFKNVAAIAIISVPFIIDLNLSDKFSIMYSADSTNVSLPAYPATTTPPAPETPSAIMTVFKISEITP